MKAIVVGEYGGVEQLKLTEVPLPLMSPNDVLIKLSFAGVNFVDSYERKGLYPIQLPFIPGKEGVGVIVDKGANIRDFSIGDRVGFAYVSQGAYAEYIAVDASQIIAIPPEIHDDVASACLLQGVTAHFLTHDTFPLNSSHTSLIHAAAGGVGSLAVQFAKLRGASVIGTVSSEEKAIRAKQSGADLVIRYDQADFAHVVLDWTNGFGVDVIYDSVGVSTWERNLLALKSRGLIVLYGQSSGVVPPIEVNQQLGRRMEEKGSFYITRPVIRHYTANHGALESRSQEIFKYITNGRIEILVSNQFSLEEAQKAHEILEERKAIGKLLLKIN